MSLKTNILPKKELLQVEVTNASYHEVLSAICCLGSQRTSSYVCVANVHMVVETHLNHCFKAVLENAEIVVPDGKPLSVLMNFLYNLRQERVAGPELMISLFEIAERDGLRIFFYGSTSEVLAKMLDKLTYDYPKLQIAGMISPPFRPLTAAEDEEITEQINASGAHIVMVALGCPKQEQWMHDHQDKINAVMLGVGAAFPFYTKDLQRAPKWMQDSSLEWLYRLLCEPRRLFKRYVMTNSLFILMVMGQLVRRFLLIK
jgi:N-acetylglucosaminyldiphosphoundecaprenol N-acetyl-beta-D-mannosaminyltransferase